MMKKKSLSQEPSKKATKKAKKGRNLMAEFCDNEYKKAEKRKHAAFKHYVHQNNLHYTKFGLQLIREEGKRPVVIISSKLMMDKDIGKEITKICPSEKGLNLRNRCSSALMLNDDESFEICWDDGTLIAVVLRNVFSDEEAALSLLFEEEHKKHSVGWNRGCEADLVPRENQMRYQVNNTKAMKSTGINPNAIINSVKHGGKGETTGTRMYYQHPNGHNTSVPFSMYIDRKKWLPSGEKKDVRSACIDHYLESNIEAKLYYSKMKTIYLKVCAQFMKSTVEEISDNIMKTIRLNTNIIDDKESTMGIHHDMPTPTPAMVTGPSNYILDNGEWRLKHRGGRLFLAEGLFSIQYGPRDIVAFDGNVPHGLTRMKPLDEDDTLLLLEEIADAPAAKTSKVSFPAPN
eukprot:scaffold20865_cov150-Skeletonema_marinoi.AAC.3